ncbi:MAG: low molecular weight protein arginine phosphatase [Clostridia bacterium]|nr:low molecular weight protein arginine phosphatase [Clostridia bacterium]
MRIIFICTGNICRSPMAMAYLRKKVEDNKLKSKIEVLSAGINAVDGDEATEYAKQVMYNMGIDLTYHRATNVKDIDIKNADYIIAMTLEHKDKIVQFFPQVKDRVYLLKEFSQNKDYLNVDDPWGLNLHVYEHCAREIVECVDKFYEEIIQRVDNFRR